MSRARSLNTVSDAEARFVVDGPEPDSVLEGQPVTSTAVLDEGPDGRVVRGLWRITPGVVTDVEADELFVVLSGSATVTFDDGEVWQLGPGSVGVFVGGERTTWRVTETLTKVFQITDDPFTGDEPGEGDRE